jgi:hypothetical protein
MEEIKTLKTPNYVRKAVDAYYLRKKDDPAFKAKQSARCKAAYQRKKLEKLKKSTELLS